MNQGQFDRLTRNLAFVANRRTVLRGAIGLIGGAVTGTALIGETKAARRGFSGPTLPALVPTPPPDPCAGIVCDTPPDACHNTAGFCDAGVCRYTQILCDPPDPCYSGGICNVNTGTCDYTVLPPGTSCGDCMVCVGFGVCEPVVCEDPPDECYESPGFCFEGVCRYTRIQPCGAVPV